MMRRALILASLTAFPLLGDGDGVEAQGVVVDQGRFSVRMNGVEVGSEEFSIRRPGVGRDDAVFANASISLTHGGVTSTIRPLLRAEPVTGAADSYQVSVSGADAMEIRLARSGRRYVATIRSPAGDEDREFQARSDTRILELDVAHQYYFLRDARAQRPVFVIEPRTRRQFTLMPGEASDAQLTIGANVVSARVVNFEEEGGDVRRVWFDRQGRVLRVEIPARGFVAQRADLVG